MPCSQVTDLGGLRALTELNLRRNRLEVVAGLDELPSLQRLFLSNNNVTSFDNIDCIFKVRAGVKGGGRVSRRRGLLLGWQAHVPCGRRASCL